MTARKWFYGANIVYKVVLMFNKISIACLYYRIFAVSSRSFRIACHVMNAWIVSSSLAFIIATTFQCTPVAAFWDRSIPGFKCFKNEPWWISYATTQISTDFALLLMPIPQIMTLSMGRAEKLGICLVFGTGALYVLLQLSRHALTRTASPLHPSIVPLRLPHQRATPTLLGGQFLPLSGPLSRPTPVLSAPVYPCFAVLSLDSSVQSLVGHEGQ